MNPETFGETYREEARELLCELENTLLELESAPQDGELIARTFRALHTIKGSGSMFGFDEIARFTHDVETTFDRVRSGGMAVDRPLIDLTLQACDHIRALLEGEPPAVSGLGDAFRALHPPAAAEAAPASSDESGEATWRIRFRPHPDLMTYGTNPLLLLGELTALGRSQVTACTERVPCLEDLDAEACYLSWDVILTTAAGRSAIADVFIFVEGEGVLDLARVDADGSPPRVGDILVERGDVAREALEEVLGSRKRVGELLVDAGLVHGSGAASALAEQAHLRALQRPDAPSSSVRVPAVKLDALVNLVGELVTVHSRLTQMAVRLDHAPLIQVAEEVERLTADLRDTTMSIRMLPIGRTFERFARLLRDLERELGKEVVLETLGGETELDKTVIERLGDPLVHLIRNAVDHGIEQPAARLAAAKPRHGTVRLVARHEGANVSIEIRDDGAGIDVDKLRQRAVAVGLLTADAVLAERDLLALIFQPGLSTCEEVTAVSGRGVGMDVVKRAIDALAGSIDIESSLGKGTAITLKLPLTLAIIDGLLVRLEDAFYVLPLANIEECVELTRDDLHRQRGQNLALIRGELVPYVPLRDSFGIVGQPPAIEQIVTSRVDGRRVGFVVDQVVGQHQTVIKSLGRTFKDVGQFSGATILGDGTVALIVDVPGLVRRVECGGRN